MMTALAMKIQDDTLLAQVMASNLLGDNEKAIYKAISEHGPITKEQVVTITGIKHPWSYFGNLKSRGMITQAKQKTRASNGKKVMLLVVTSKPPVACPRIIGRRKQWKLDPRPTDGELKAFSKELSVILAVAFSKGARISSELQKVQKWLAGGAICACIKPRKLKPKFNDSDDLIAVAKKFTQDQ